MAQKKKEKDVLVVRDEKTGEIGVVSGLNGDGTPKTTPPRERTNKISCHSTRTVTRWKVSLRISTASARNRNGSGSTV